MPKLTTEDCKREINQRWPVEGSKSPQDWKRVSKTGTAKTSIVRVFQHKRLAIFATVVEVNDTIVSVTFVETQPETASEAGARSKTRGAAKPSSGSAEVPTEPTAPASNGKVRADEFVFAVSGRSNGVTYFAICRRDYWIQNHHLSDTGFGDLLNGLLPDDASEISECQYSTKMNAKALYAWMMRKGFLDDERFTDYMANTF